MTRRQAALVFHVRVNHTQNSSRMAKQCRNSSSVMRGGLHMNEPQRMNVASPRLRGCSELTLGWMRPL